MWRDLRSSEAAGLAQQRAQERNSLRREGDRALLVDEKRIVLIQLELVELQPMRRRS